MSGEERYIYMTNTHNREQLEWTDPDHSPEDYAAETTPIHETIVELVAGQRYPWRPKCSSCGWTGRGYVAAHAAQAMCEAHKRGEV